MTKKSQINIEFSSNSFSKSSLLIPNHVYNQNPHRKQQSLKLQQKISDRGRNENDPIDCIKIEVLTCQEVRNGEGEQRPPNGSKFNLLDQIFYGPDRLLHLVPSLNPKIPVPIR